MAVYENAEVRRGGSVVRKNVIIDSAYVALTAPETLEWSGRLLPPNNTGLVMGDTYQLLIPGCTPARILITGEADPNDSSIPFQGVGAAPTSAHRETADSTT